MKVTEDEMNKKICDNCSLAAAVVQLASAKDNEVLILSKDIKHKGILPTKASVTESI